MVQTRIRIQTRIQNSIQTRVLASTQTRVLRFLLVLRQVVFRQDFRHGLILNVQTRFQTLIQTRFSTRIQTRFQTSILLYIVSDKDSDKYLRRFR